MNAPAHKDQREPFNPTGSTFSHPTHMYEIPLHKNLQSEARWLGRRVGEAIASKDFAKANYEDAWFKRFLAALSPTEAADAGYIFDLARRAAILRTVAAANAA